MEVGKGSGGTRRYGFPQQERSDAKSYGVWRGLGTRPQAGCGAAALRLLVQRRRLRFRRSRIRLKLYSFFPFAAR